MRSFKITLLILAVCAAGFLFFYPVLPKDSLSAKVEPSSTSVKPPENLKPEEIQSSVPVMQMGSSNVEAVVLIQSGEATDMPWTSRTPAAKRVRRIFPDEKIMAPNLVLKTGDHIELALFDDVVFYAEISNVTRYPNGAVGMTAHLRNGREGTVYLSYCGGQLRASVQVIGGADFYVRYKPETGGHYAVEVDRENSIILEGAEPMIPPAGDAAAEVSVAAAAVLSPVALADAPVGSIVVDVMIVYTPAARISEGGTNGMNNNIGMAMQKANEAHTNSNTQVYLNLVHSAEVNYTEVNADADLYNLTRSGGTNSAMDEVQSWRDLYGADFICLFESTDEVGGLGWLLTSTGGRPSYAFCLARVQQSDSTYTVVHEWGHNMGCNHSKTQTFQPGTDGVYSYSAGWQWSDTRVSPKIGYCSIMTYEDFNDDGYPYDYKRVPYFSNPSINYIGNSTNATGHATDGDNARTIRQMKTVLAEYRGTVPPMTLSLSGSPMAESGGVARVTATLSSVSALSVTVNLAFSGTATRTNDYTSSGTNIVISAGSTMGSILLTAVQDTIYEGNETIVVDVISVVNGIEIGVQQVVATITDNDQELSVTPLTGATFVKPVGGVSSPLNQVYVLMNAGTNAINWTASQTGNWVVFSATNGALAAGAMTNVIVSVNTGALAEGAYSDTITFSNTTRGAGITRSASLTMVPPYVYFFSLDTNPGWTMQGEWAFGHPAGQGGVSHGKPDPFNGVTGANVFGVNLDGDYSTIPATPNYLTVGPLNFSSYTNVVLHFQRWLNTDWSSFVSATIEVSTNGTTWSRIFTNPNYLEIVSTNWSRQTNSISSVADRQATVYVRWGYQIVSANAFTYSGWNIDDVGFLGTEISTPDADADGLSDSWELQYFNGITNAVAGADPDGDGFSNLQEYIAGTIPTNSQSFLNISSLAIPSGGAEIRWGAVSGRVYSVYWQTNLQNGFQPLATNIIWPQAGYTDTVHSANPDGFYKINVRMAP